MINLIYLYQKITEILNYRTMQVKATLRLLIFEGLSPVFVDRGIRTYGFEPWLSQTNDFKNYTCRFLARRSALLGEDKDWLAQCQDNTTEQDIRLWWPSLPVE